MTFNIGSDVSVCSHVGISLCVAKGEYLMLHHLAANPFWSSASPDVQVALLFLPSLISNAFPVHSVIESAKYFATLCMHLRLPSPQLKREGCLSSPLFWALPLRGGFVISSVRKRLVKYFYKKKREMHVRPVSVGPPEKKIGSTGVHWGGSSSSSVHLTLHLVLFTLPLVAMAKILVALSEEKRKLLAAMTVLIWLFW